VDTLIKMKCDDTEIWMEVEEVAGEVRPQRVGVSESLGKTVHSFEKISDTIRAYCASLVKTFQGINQELAPNRIKAEFGLKLSGEGNVYVVKSAAEASLRITAEWQIK
jgi:nucleotidyltransferase/DNA polymerase involved in DNA repair